MRRPRPGPPAQGLAQTTGDSQAVTPFRIFAVVWRGETEVEQGFRDYLTQRGIPFEMTVRNLNLDRGNAPPIVEEIKRVRPDLVYTWGTGTTLSIVGKIGTDTPESFVRDIPAVFTLVSYPKVADIVESYESTGRPVTGVAFLAPVETQSQDHPGLPAVHHHRRHLRPDRRQLAHQCRRPARSCAGAGHQPESSCPCPWERTASRTRPHCHDWWRRPGRPAPSSSTWARIPFLTRHAKAYTTAALAAGLPTFAATQAPLKNSRAMFGLVTDYHTLGKLTALQAERILVEGRRPEDLPVARLARYKLWINMDVMRDLRLYPPMDMIAIADFKTSPGG